MEEKILAAAERLFLENGYPLTSTTQIAKEVGCNQALVHYYFRTKEKLFQTVLGGKFKKVFREFLRLETGDGNFEEKLTRMIELHYDTVRENSAMVLFLMNGLTRDPEMFEGLIEEVGNTPGRSMEIFKEELAEEIDAGRVRPVTLQNLLLNVISLNVFLFAIKPVYLKVWGMDQNQMEELLDRRKKEIVETVLLSLRP